MSKRGAASMKVDRELLPAQGTAGADAPARAERRDALLRFLADPPRNIVEAALALRGAEQQYGDDTDLELADLEAGQHPLQLARADFSKG